MCVMNTNQAEVARISDDVLLPTALSHFDTERTPVVQCISSSLDDAPTAVCCDPGTTSGCAAWVLSPD